MDEIEKIKEEHKQKKAEIQAHLTWWKRWLKVFGILMLFIIPIQLLVLYIWSVFN